MMVTTTYPGVKWSEVILLSFVYALFLAVVTAPLGFIISAVKVYIFKRDVEKGAASPDEETLLVATHYEWLVRTFIFMVVLVMATVGLLYYIWGFVIGGVAVVWWFYRLIRGIVALMAYRSMPATICTHEFCYGTPQSKSI